MSGLETVRYEALVSFDNALLERSGSMFVLLKYSGKKKSIHNKCKLSETFVSFTNSSMSLPISKGWVDILFFVWIPLALVLV